MRALCPDCGFHHQVVRVLEDGHGESSRDMYQVSPLMTCERTWLSDKDILEARAKYGQDAILEDDELEE
ncbi:MAG TPA: hypothetical protein VLS89_19885 [Candidatus Nanopelagicales bacterium]|nr:hypothetical protein [Candidatus Nanopelagicales bacterium]